MSPPPLMLRRVKAGKMDYDKLFGNVVDEGKSVLAGSLSGTKDANNKPDSVPAKAEDYVG